MDFPLDTFTTYLALAVLSLSLLFCLCIRMSTYSEETCQLPFFSKRKFRKSRDEALNDILFPSEAMPPILLPPNMAAPSGEIFTKDIIYQSYIYRDAYNNTGLSHLSGKDLQQGLSLDVDTPVNRNPFDAVIMKESK